MICHRKMLSIFQHFLKEGRNCLFNLYTIFSPVGSWNLSPLPTHPLPVSRHPSGPAGRQQHDREAGKEQTAPPISWGRREAGSWAEGCQICGVLCSDTGTCVPVAALSWYCRTEISRVKFLPFFLFPFLFSTSEGLRMCLTRPSWQPWSLLRPKPRESAFCYRWPTTVRGATVYEIGWMNQSVRKINGHYEKKEKRGRSKRRRETYPNTSVHWLCLQTKLWKRLRKQNFS